MFGRSSRKVSEKYRIGRRTVIATFLVCLVSLVFAGDYALWNHHPARQGNISMIDAFFADRNQWAAHCWMPARMHKLHCGIIFSYFMNGPSDADDWVIVVVTRHLISITAPIKRFSVVSLRVDNLPFEEMATAEDDGVVFPPAFSTKLFTELLTGKQLTIRFNWRGNGAKTEKVIPLDEFPRVYSQYLRLLNNPHL
jgi:hypothetical protein